MTSRRSRSNLSQRSMSRQNVRNRSALLRPPDKTFKQQARDFIWDKEKKTCLTRTPRNWCAVAIYYAIFLGIVILIFAISLKITDVATDQDYGPQYILEESPIGPSPTLNFFPLNGSQNLIWLSKNRSYSDYVEIISREFDKYKKADRSFDVSKFEECGKPPYGYDIQSPCIYLRLNRLILWEPIPYHKGDRLPKYMPDPVKHLVETTDIPMVWVSCEGTMAKDRDHLPPDVFTFKGKQGFTILGYPFERQEDYVDPIVAVQIKKEAYPKIIFSLTCHPWSKKMNHQKTSVDVTLYIE